VTLPEQERHYEDRQIRLERRSPFYWRVTFDHPPLNIFGPETTAGDVEDRLEYYVGQLGN
jgi:hypothetical protein